MGSRTGALKTAAKRTGTTPEEYSRLCQAGFKHCGKCKTWLKRDLFYKNRAMSDGHDNYCIECRVKTYHTIKDVGTRERRAKRSIGLYWCKDCCNWRPADLMSIRSSGQSDGLCREHINHYQRERYKSSPERQRKAYKAAKERRAKAKPVSAKEKRRLLSLFDGLCAYCKKHSFEEWDHFIPLKHGGKGVPGNILPSCRQCNRSKHAENPFDWIEKQGSQFSATVLLVVNTPQDQVVYKHKRNRNQEGELNPTARITNTQAKKIRKQYATGKYSYFTLAREYGIGPWIVSRAVRGETYRHGHQD